MSYSTPEGKVVRKLLDYANALPRTTAHKVHGGPHTIPGEPDLDIVCNGRAVKVEVKQPGTEAAIKRAVTPSQRARLRQYDRAGAIVGVCTSVDELACVLFDAQHGQLVDIDLQVEDILDAVQRMRGRWE
jgi:hypothetical protein